MPAGYSREIFLSTVPEKYLCSYCHLILKGPVQTYCGHRYCGSCVQDIISQPGLHSCIVCGDEHKDDPDCLITSEQIFPDNAIKRELRVHNVKCINNGCTWTGMFKDYEEHVSVCPHGIIVCIKSGCNDQILRGDLAQHLEHECLMRVVQCQFCHEEITFKELKAHHEKCPRFLISCEFCGKNNIPREKYADHIDAEKGDCKKKLKPCKYKPAGCNKMVEVDKDQEHLKKAQVAHLDLLLCMVSTLISNVEDFEEEVDILGVSRRSDELQGKIEELKNGIKELAKTVAKATSAQTSKGDELVMGKEFEPIIGRQSRMIADLKNKITVLETKLSTYEGIVAVLNGQIERDSQVVKTVERQRRQDKELIESLERKIRAQDRIIALKDVALAEQDLRIKALEQTSYDGILVWKIKDFTKKQQDAVSGRTTSIYSPSFFTSRHGYKMCARIYLNGDGMGRGNHVSLFFVIMKGPYDALLRWPFRQKVTFMLLDQNNREHVIDAFRPDPTSSSFKRPTSDMNIASGCPLFMPISQIDSGRHAYVKDDVMFIKIIVDTSDLA
ncbi:TNF receptor-associated factor 2-like [Ptychodera flava]|uniref:TNF receptor-associated factor 2-like n=1 Tax=Ptychodera flava TaxID=63121 RepID=UPI00396A140E